MKIGIYSFWNLQWDGQTLCGQSCHLRYIEYFLKYCQKVRLFSNIISWEDQKNTEQIRSNKLEVIKIPWKSWVQTWIHLPKLYSLLSKNLDNLNSIYVRLFDPGGWLLAPLCQKKGIGLVYHIVGDPLAGIFQRSDWSEFGKWTRRLMFWPEEKLVKLATYNNNLIIESGELAQLMRQRGFHGDEVASSTLEPADFFIREDTCKAQEPVVLMVSHFRPPKKAEVLIESIAILLKRGRRVRLRLVGPFEPATYRTFLEAKIHSLGIKSQVDFAGFVPLGEPLRNELRSGDIFAFSSATEGNPRVLLEAAANSLPIVTTAVGSVGRMYPHGECALVVPKDDAAAMAAAIEHLIEDGELRKKIIRNAYVMAQNNTCEKFIQEIVRRLAMAASKNN